MNCKMDCMSCILSLYFSQQTMFHSRSLTDLKGLLKQREIRRKIFTTRSRLVLRSFQWILRGQSLEVRPWKWPPMSVKCQGYECVELSVACMFPGHFGSAVCGQHRRSSCRFTNIKQRTCQIYEVVIWINIFRKDCQHSC